MESLTRQKLALLTEIWELTKAETFTGKPNVLEEETNRFSALYEKRAVLFARVQELDRRLEAEPPETDDEPLAQEIRQTMQNILAQDKAYAVVAQGLMTHIKNGMRDLRLGKAASTKYQTEYTVGGGLHYDSRN